MKLLFSVDEKWPVFELEIPHDEDDADCICSKRFYREYSRINHEFNELQKELAHFYEQQQRKSNEPCNYSVIPESIIAEHNSQPSIILPSEDTLWPLLPKSP